MKRRMGFVGCTGGVGILVLSLTSCATHNVRSAVPTQNVGSTGEVEGRITNTRGEPAAYANVLVASQDGGRADSLGRYRILLVPAGACTLSIRAMGYARQDRVVSIVRGRTLTVDFKL